MVPYFSSSSAVPCHLLEQRKAPAVKLVVKALSSANPADLASSSNLEAGIITFIQSFQVATGLLSAPELAQYAVDAGAIEVSHS